MNKPRLISIVLIGLTALTAAFFLGRLTARHATETVAGPSDGEVSAAAEADVIRRVSQQMEEIAYQQLAISNQQRERAEKQSEMADRMRIRAEAESQVARQAEQRAVAAAAEAERQRASALEHQAEAEMQRDQATLAKHVSDSLNTGILGRSLSERALLEYESGKHDTAAKLAYLSWHLLTKVNENLYHTASYRALLDCSQGISQLPTVQGGGVTALVPVPAKGYALVTDYGGMELADPALSRSDLQAKNDEYDFKSLCCLEETLWGLCSGGTLVSCRDGRTQQYNLPGNKYLKVLPADGNCLWLVASGKCCRFNTRTKALELEKNLDKAVTAAALMPDGLLLCYKDGTAALLDRKGEAREMTLPAAQGTVTAAAYDAGHGVLMLGYSQGDIRLTNAKGTLLATMYGHTSIVTAIARQGDVFVSTSYDKTMNVWYCEPLYLKIEQAGSPWLPEGLSWYNPASVEFGSWPLSLCLTDDGHAAVGMADGTVSVLDLQANRMAGRLKDLLPEGITADDWNLYVGPQIPYENL